MAGAAVVVATAAVGLPIDVGGPGGDLVTMAPGQAQDAGARPTGVLPPDGRWTVTLLTGEVVDVWSDAEGRVDATVREHSGPLRSLRKPNGDLYVMPVRVTPLLAEVLDHELFNVTGLVRQRYDDAATGAVPLIVERAPGTEVTATLSTAEGEQPLPSIGAVATEVPKSDAQATGALLAGLSDGVDEQTRSVAGITRIWLDRRVSTRSAAPARVPVPAGQAPPQLDPNLTQVGADDAWAAGLTGDGVRVAVLDTGIDAQHPDLAGQVVAQQNFSTSPDTVDRFGHGTHVASIVAGTGAAAEGARTGVAPQADLLVGKVLGDDGFGAESDVIAGMEWAAPQAAVINMSLGAGFPTDGSDPLSLAVDQLSEQHGTLFVVAAGNTGPTSQTVETPGAADRALTVGAVDAGDALADFSSRGPLIDSNELKPELVAPGVDVVAARASHTAMGEPVDSHYTAASGTSMASPHVAGAAAILAQQHPDWTGDQLKSALIGSADPLDADGFDRGAGRLDVGDGMGAGVLAQRDVVDVPLAHPRTEPHTEPLTWANPGGEPLTVNLRAELEDRRGEPVDAVAVEPARLTIPAGGTASATLQVDGAALEAGLHSGIVTADPVEAGAGPGPGDAGADAPDDAVDDPDDARTPVGVHAAPEMATLTLQATPHPDAGGGEPFGGISIVNLDDYATFNLVDGVYFGSSPSIDVPLGRYAVLGDVTGDSFDGQVVAAVGDPDVIVDGDTTVAFDGSAAAPYRPTVEGIDTAPPVASNVGAVLTPDAGTGGFGIEVSMFSWYPVPIYVTEGEGNTDNVAVRSPIVRLQAPPITAAAGPGAGRQPIEVTFIDGARPPAEGTHAWPAVDVGDGSDLSSARDALAVVQLHADREERRAITVRALEAGVAAVAFVDESRPVLTLDTSFTFTGPWADVPAVAAAGASARALRAAASAGQEVTITVTASPFVYDVVLPPSDGLDPHPVVTRSEQEALARLDERFHGDADGTGARSERRRARSVSQMELDTVGPLPERRTAYVTPDVTWQSSVSGDGYIDFPGFPWPPEPARVAYSITPESTYASGSRQRLDWLRRPMAPGAVGVGSGRNGCQPAPVRRTVDTLHVDLAPFQDGRDRFGCNAPLEATLTVERDGTVVGTVPTRVGEFPVPAEPGDYRLTYQQSGVSPYPHRSTTAWSFRSAGDPEAGFTRIPLLRVDYGLPLDILNRPTSRTATFTVHHVSGVDERRIDGLQVWTSTDDGVTWQPAPVRRRQGGEFRVTLPDVATGTGVSLRVDARDVAGSRIEQTLVDAYVG